MENQLTDYLKNLKKVREELSKMSGVSYSTLTKLESGFNTNPSFQTILRISKALDIRIDDLVGM